MKESTDGVGEYMLTDQEDNVKPIQPEQYHAVKGTIICQFPISVGYKSNVSMEQRKKKKSGFKSHDDLKGWARLGLDKGNNINFFITIQSKFGIYQLRISQWNLLRMIKYRLCLRPIHQKKTDFYAHEGIKTIPYYENIFELPIEEVQKQYDKSFANMKSVVRLAEGEEKERKEKQLEELIRMQGQIQLWDTMKACEHCKLEAGDEYNFDLK